MLSASQSHFKIIGAMSGTSLDGLDLATIIFEKGPNNWPFQIEKATTVAYPDELTLSLKEAITQDEAAIKKLDLELGGFIGEAIKSFCTETEKVDFVSSHGHTIFHQPDQGVTLQIGNGAVISEICGLPVINNFRQKDVSLGGQGAPLVPIGDRDLFGDYRYCLNLGGIANISYQAEGKRLAFDICPFNMVLNELAGQKGLAYDTGGLLARHGQLNEDLLNTLNAISYLQKTAPKSLGLEDYKHLWAPVLNDSTLKVEDKLSTVVEHAAIQISRVFSKGDSKEKLLVTGGGAFNDYFIERLKALCILEVVIPDEKTINFKEALVFAYLGLLRYLEQTNTLASVTGASRDSSGGDLYNF